MNNIVTMLVDDLVSHLEDKMITNPPATVDLEYVDAGGDTQDLIPQEIHKGHIYDLMAFEPGDNDLIYVLLAVHSGAPDTIKDKPYQWQDEIGSEGTQAGISYGPVHEIGGGTHWWRRLAVEFRVFMIESETAQSDAFDAAQMIRLSIETYADSYTSSNAQGWACGAITDCFNETAQQPVVLSSYCAEEGNDAGDHIYDGYVCLQVKTYKDGLS